MKAAIIHERKVTLRLKEVQRSQLFRLADRSNRAILARAFSGWYSTGKMPIEDRHILVVVITPWRDDAGEPGICFHQHEDTEVELLGLTKPAEYTVL